MPLKPSKGKETGKSTPSSRLETRAKFPRANIVALHLAECCKSNISSLLAKLRLSKKHLKGERVENSKPREISGETEMAAASCFAGNSEIVQPSSSKKGKKKSAKRKAKKYRSLGKCFIKEFRYFSRVNEENSRSNKISYPKALWWLKNAGIMDNHRVTIRDIEVHFINSIRRGNELKILDFIKFLKSLCEDRGLVMPSVLEKLLRCREKKLGIGKTSVQNKKSYVGKHALRYIRKKNTGVDICTTKIRPRKIISKDNVLGTRVFQGKPPAKCKRSLDSQTCFSTCKHSKKISMKCESVISSKSVPLDIKSKVIANSNQKPNLSVKSLPNSFEELTHKHLQLPRDVFLQRGSIDILHIAALKFPHERSMKFKAKRNESQESHYDSEHLCKSRKKRLYADMHNLEIKGYVLKLAHPENYEYFDSDLSSDDSANRETFEYIDSDPPSEESATQKTFEFDHPDLSFGKSSRRQSAENQSHHLFECDAMNPSYVEVKTSFLEVFSDKRELSQFKCKSKNLISTKKDASKVECVDQITEKALDQTFEMTNQSNINIITIPDSKKTEHLSCSLGRKNSQSSRNARVMTDNLKEAEDNYDKLQQAKNKTSDLNAQIKPSVTINSFKIDLSKGICRSIAKSGKASVINHRRETSAGSTKTKVNATKMNPTVNTDIEGFLPKVDGKSSVTNNKETSSSTTKNLNETEINSAISTQAESFSPKKDGKISLASYRQETSCSTEKNVNETESYNKIEGFLPQKDGTSSVTNSRIKTCVSTKKTYKAEMSRAINTQVEEFSPKKDGKSSVTKGNNETLCITNKYINKTETSPTRNTERFSLKTGRKSAGINCKKEITCSIKTSVNKCETSPTRNTKDERFSPKTGGKSAAINCRKETTCRNKTSVNKCETSPTTNIHFEMSSPQKDAKTSKTNCRRKTFCRTESTINKDETSSAANSLIRTLHPKPHPEVLSKSNVSPSKNERKLEMQGEGSSPKTGTKTTQKVSKSNRHGKNRKRTFTNLEHRSSESSSEFQKI